jgi:hypothetical protein
MPENCAGLPFKVPRAVPNPQARMRMSSLANTMLKSKPPGSSTGRKRHWTMVLTVFATIGIVAAGAWWFQSRHANTPATDGSSANEAVKTAKPDFQKIKGRWLRPDGGYIVEIKDVDATGKMDAAYFNPNPIHISKALASQNGEETQVFIELQDVNYPGSTYKLSYDRASDRLMGSYYQAVAQETYEIFFERVK